MKYEKMNNQILDQIGGKENIKSVVHCMTRLRFVVKEKSQINLKDIEKIDGVLQALDSGGQIQVVIGTHVGDVHAELLELIGNVPSDETQIEETKERKKFGDVLIDYISKIFLPIMGVLIASGLLKGILAILTVSGVLNDTHGTYVILHAISDAPMYFFPIIIGFSAGKAFKTNEIVTASVGAVLVYPTLVETVMTGGSLTFVGLPVILLLYTSSVFPVIIASYVASKFEKIAQKIIPNILQMILVPFFVFTITSIFAIMVIGPVSGILSTIISTIVMGIYNFSPAIAGGILGAFFQVFVIFGLHYGFLPVIIGDMTTNGFSAIAALGLPSIFAQAGACMAVFFLAKDKELKATSVSAGVSALLGITEPAIYGVTLSLKKPFYATIVGGLVGGVVMGLAGTKAYAMGLAGLLAFPTYINPTGIDTGFYGAIIGSSAAFIISFILTMVLGIKAKKKN